MIVQTAPKGEKHFIITMENHTQLSGQFATAFGNQEFDPIEPRDQMLHMIKNHDIGWRELDSEAYRDPKTGLPYNLVETPFSYIAKTSAASPEINSQHHPYCGLISSMHSWGLYNGRYGMSDKVLLDGLAAENRATADKLLEGEKIRQESLKKLLGSDVIMSEWVTESRLMLNYKLLQFFDTLALYFNCVHDDARENTTYSHIPAGIGKDVDIKIEKLDEGLYGLNPFPFQGKSLDISFSGKYMFPADTGESVKDILGLCATENQTARLIDLRNGTLAP